jgi:hypothetical protein
MLEIFLERVAHWGVVPTRIRKENAVFKTKIAIVTALVVGIATAAAAQNYRYHPYVSYRYNAPYYGSYAYDQPYDGSYSYDYSYDQPYYGSYGYGSNDHAWSGSRSGPNKGSGENGGG